MVWELIESGAKMRAKVLAPAATQTEFGKKANNVDTYNYDKAFGTYHTSWQMAEFLMKLYDSDSTLGIVDREDTKAGIWAAKKIFETYPSIQRFCADAGYRKTFEQDVSSELGLGVDISARIKPVWEVLPKRCIVERSLAWINNSRSLSKDYEISVCFAQTICTIAAFALC